MNKKSIVVLSLSSQVLNHEKTAKPNQTKPLNLKNSKWPLLTVMVHLEGEKSTLPAETAYSLWWPSYNVSEINLAINKIWPHLSLDYKGLSDEGSSTENSRMAAGDQCPLACISHRDYWLETKHVTDTNITAPQHKNEVSQWGKNLDKSNTKLSENK